MPLPRTRSSRLDGEQVADLTSKDGTDRGQGAEPESPSAVVLQDRQVDHGDTGRWRRPGRPGSSRACRVVRRDGRERGGFIDGHQTRPPRVVAQLGADLEAFRDQAEEEADDEREPGNVEADSWVEAAEVESTDDRAWQDSRANIATTDRS